MRERANEDIRNYAMAYGVKLWEVAASLGITDSTLSRKLRFKLHDEERELIYEKIRKIAASEQ